MARAVKRRRRNAEMTKEEQAEFARLVRKIPVDPDKQWHRRVPFAGAETVTVTATKSNPRRGRPVLIYDKVLEIQAQKGAASQYSRQKFYHPFTSKARVYGLPNGDLLITGRTLR